MSAKHIGTIEEQAATWVVRLHSDQSTEADWIALTDWLEQSETHLVAFEAAELSFDACDELRQGLLEALAPPSGPASGLSSGPASLLAFRRPRRRIQAMGVALAASGLMAASLVLGFLALGPSSGPTQIFRTGTGELRNVVLADDSHIELDAASDLDVRLGWARRQAFLRRGQASFDIAHDPRRPFLVSVGDQEVRVVGTEFDILADANQTQITVRRGVVLVSQASDPRAPVARLTVGEVLTHQLGSGRSQIARVNPDSAFQWRVGRIVCDNEELSSIVAELNRRYPTPIYLSASAARRRFTGVLHLDDQSNLVRRLAHFLSLRESRSANAIMLR